MAFVYSITLFINAALLFIIEPMVAKMILPFLGGSPAVWNTSLVFYQACLLAGYAYAHYGCAWLGTRRHALVHLNLLFAALLLLPIVLPLDWLGAPAKNPVNLVLGVLALSIGFPFLVLSAGAPLLQKWFAQCHPGTRQDPYFLYAASNAGSLAGLLAYPFLLEPRLPLSRQNHLWFIGYLVLLALVSLCVLYFLRPLTGQSAEKSNLETDRTPMSTGDSLTFARRLRWIVWGFVPSSLLLGVTSFLTTDIGSAPFLWVLPLAAYLMSFIVAFARSSWMSHPILLRAQAFFLVGVTATVFLHVTEPDEILLPLHLIGFFITALVCHGRLAQDRPSAKHLTDYFLWLSLGGVLGGVFNALFAPSLFKHVVEYPLVIAVAGLIRPQSTKRADTPRGNPRLDWLLPPVVLAIIVLITLALKQVQILPPTNDRLLICGLSALFLLAVAYRPVRFGMGLLLLSLVSLWYPSPIGKVLYTGRSFFGAYRAATDAEGKRNVLFQGTTFHGAQSIDRQTHLTPQSYYHRTSPAGQVLMANASRRNNARVAIVGLGTGALACYGTAHQAFTFYEIDPLVEQIARDDRLFTYLRDCPPRIQVVIGDARLSLANTADRSYDLFVLDAFSSDVIPVHLLTREALKLYLAKTASDGILLFHISNRYMDLAPVLDRLAADLGLAAFIQNDFNISAVEKMEGKIASRWVLMARDQQVAAPYLAAGHWRQLDGHLRGDLWTDDYSDLLRVLHWR